MAPLHPRIELTPETDERRDYANSKVKEVVRDYEEDVDARPPLKVVLLGNSGVGKTSIVLGSHDSIPPVTIGATFTTSYIDVNKKAMRLQVWDTAGQERFRCMVPMYMRNAAAALIVFDLTNRQSFEDVGKWENELRRSCNTSYDPQIVLVGNKADLSHRRVVARGEAVTKAIEMRASYVEMSAGDDNFSRVLSSITTSVPFPSSLLYSSCSSSPILSLSPSPQISPNKSCCPSL